MNAEHGEESTHDGVLGADDKPIAGLYAAGSTGQGGLLLKGHGHHLGWAFASGRRAGRNAASAAVIAGLDPAIHERQLGIVRLTYCPHLPTLIMDARVKPAHDELRAGRGSYLTLVRHRRRHDEEDEIDQPGVRDRVIDARRQEDEVVFAHDVILAVDVHQAFALDDVIDLLLHLVPVHLHIGHRLIHRDAIVD